MNLRVKTLSLVVATLLISAAALFYVASSVVGDSYGTLERQSADRDLQRLERVFLADLKRLFLLLEDYAHWDETYNFVLDRNEEYVRSNFSPSTFSNPDVDIFMIVDKQGNAVLSTAFVTPKSAAQPALDHLLIELGPDGELFEDDPEEYGVVVIGSKILLVAMAPIHRSDGEGTSRGIMLSGRFLDDARLSQLREKTQLDISVHALSDPESLDQMKAGPGESKQRLQQFLGGTSSLANPAHLIRPIDDTRLVGHLLMPDLLGGPQLLWSVTIPRHIYQQGGKSLNFLLLAIGIVGLTVVACVVLLLDKLVLRRVARLRMELARIGETDDLSARVTSQGSDEIGFLADAVNGMLAQLKISKDKLQVEHERSEELLLNILPERIADQLKTTHEQIANAHEEVTVLFADLVGFTSMSAEMEAADLVLMLNDIFSRFDDLAENLGLEKIKTIGDAYMVAAGLPDRREDHAEAIADMALQMVVATEEYSKALKRPVKLRVGINTGQVVAGVIGKKKFIYDLWGDTVNIASRMESSGETDTIQVSEATYRKIRHAFDLRERGLVTIKGRGDMMVYVLNKRKSGNA